MRYEGFGRAVPVEPPAEPLFIGASAVAALYLGDTPVNAAYLGGSQVYGP